MEKSRKMVFYALALLLISQFFAYESIGRTSISMGLNYFEGGLPTGGRTGWVCHNYWLFIIMAGLAFLFLTAPRHILLYIVLMVGFIALGLGDGMGGIMGLISIVMMGYAIYLKTKETKVNKVVNGDSKTGK